MEKKVYQSLEELMSSCSNSVLKSNVSSVLRSNEHIKWSFVFASLDGDECQSELCAQIEGSNLERRLSCKINPQVESWHTSISGFTPTVACKTF